MTPVKAPETAATRAAAIAMTTVGELSGEDTAHFGIHSSEISVASLAVN